MKPGSARRFDLPPNVLGCLEWSTGLLRINSTLKQWTLAKAILDRPRDSTGLSIPLDSTSLDDLAIAGFVRTAVHEQFHYRQVVATGYLYRLACSAYFTIMKSISRAASGDPVRIEAMIEGQLPPMPEVAQLFEEIDQPGTDEITVRDIVESAAHLYECKASYPAFTHETYSDYLDTPGLLAEYGSAYRYAARELGPEAFHSFLVAAALALCFDQPHMAFADIIREIRRAEVAYRQRQDLPAFNPVLSNVSRSHKYIGTSAKAIDGSWSGGPQIHPYYAGMVNAIVNDGGSEEALLTFIIDRQFVHENNAVYQPLLLNDNDLVLPESFLELDPPRIRRQHYGFTGTMQEFIDIWLTEAAICYRVTAATGRQLHYRINS